MNASHGEPPGPAGADASQPPRPPGPPPVLPAHEGTPQAAAPPAPGAAPAQGQYQQAAAGTAPPAYPADQAFVPGDGLGWSPISKRHTWHRLLTAVLWAVPVGAIGGFLVSRNGGVLGAVLWGVAVLIAIGLSGIVAELSCRSFGYAERTDDFIVTQGVFVKRLIVVPYGRMQFVDVTAGLLERWMGIATVQMHTAAAATDARIPGLPATEAAMLRDRLAKKGEERSMGL